MSSEVVVIIYKQLESLQLYSFLRNCVSTIQFIQHLFFILIVARKAQVQVQVETLVLSQVGVGVFVYEFILSKCLWDALYSVKGKSAK